MADYTLGFIGTGNMGGAILEGIIAQGAIAAGDIFAYDALLPARERAARAGASVLENAVAVAQRADIVLLCVKPKDALAVIRDVSAALNGKALLSIVAGLSYAAIVKSLNGAEVRLLTVLPNTPIRVGAATGFTAETTFTPGEQAFAQRLFESVGIVEWVPARLLPVVSALSGGGPAYAAIFVEALADGGVLDGLPRDTACRLAAQTLAGTGKLLLETGAHPGSVKDAVCSPGGTTIEAVMQLEKHQFRYAVISALRKSKEKFERLL